MWWAHLHLSKWTFSHALAAAAVLEILIQADFNADQLSGVTGTTECVLQSLVHSGKTLFYIQHADLLFMVKVLVWSGYVYFLVRLFDLREIVLSREASASAVFLPLVLNQTSRGHEVQHVVNRGCRYWAGV